MDDVLVMGLKPQFEYFCRSCGQLRLSFDKKLTDCGNCGDPISIRAAMGELNAARLRKSWREGLLW